MSQNSAKGRLSSQMSPDERNKIQELRRKISEATKSHHGANSPRISAAASQKAAGSFIDSHPSLHYAQALSSNRRGAKNLASGHASSQIALDFNSP